jgi:hypothetical protein
MKKNALNAGLGFRVKGLGFGVGFRVGKKMALTRLSHSVRIDTFVGINLKREKKSIRKNIRKNVLRTA